jgi:hypothetical protein
MPTDPTIDTEQESDNSSLGLEHEQYTDPSSMLDGHEILSCVFSNYFEYQHNDGTTLNIADALLLIRQSINENTVVLKELTTAVTALANKA